MSLVGPRPKSAFDLPPKKARLLPRAGTCFYCRAPLKTDLDAQLHKCDPVATSKYARLGQRDGRVRL